MSHILNFKNWYRVYEAEGDLTGSTPADLAALDSIQRVADKSATMLNRVGTNSGKPEKLTTMVGTTTGNATALGLATGQPYKVMVFKTSTDPLDKSVKTNTIKAIFLAEGGVLKATVYKNDVQLLSGPVAMKNHGTWTQITAIGSDSNYVLDEVSGVEGDGNGADSSPIAGGIANIIGMKAQAETIAAAVGVPRGESNVKYSKDHSLLTNFVSAERAKATPTQKP
jgi:hypothetical protein